MSSFLTSTSSLWMATQTMTMLLVTSRRRKGMTPRLSLGSPSMQPLQTPPHNLIQQQNTDKNTLRKIIQIIQMIQNTVWKMQEITGQRGSQAMSPLGRQNMAQHFQPGQLPPWKLPTSQAHCKTAGNGKVLKAVQKKRQIPPQVGKLRPQRRQYQLSITSRLQQLP